MLGIWMLTYLILGALLLVVATAAERVATWQGWPRRWSWAVAILAMLLTPFAPRPLAERGWLSLNADWLAPADGVAADSAREVLAASPGNKSVPQVQGRARQPDDRAQRPATRSLQGMLSQTSAMLQRTDATSVLERWTVVLLAAWATLSLVLGMLVLHAAGRLRRARATWQPADDATRDAVSASAGRHVAVWIAPDTGPAAFGLGRLQVVLPSWVRELPDDERALLLAHEAAHVRAGDPRLLAGALLALVLLPWHLPLLYAYRRLCRAVEHDCDARVLARHPDAQRYGRLLVRTAEWLLVGRGTWRHGAAARWILAPVPAFAAPASELEDRLRALLPRVASWRVRLGTGWRTAAGAGALMAACVVPTPTASRLGQAVRGPTVLDSIAEYQALERHPLRTARFRDRMQQAEDSLMLSAAREAIPDFDARLTGRDTVMFWLVFDPHYRLVAHRMTTHVHDFAWVADRGGPSDAAARPATDETPRSDIMYDLWSWARAFPTINPRRIAVHGWVQPITPDLQPRVQYARLFAGDTTQYDISVARGDTLHASAWMVRVAQWFDDRIPQDSVYERAFASGLREALETFRPEFTLPGNGDDSYVWFVFGPDGTPMTHDVGRAGLGAFGQFEAGGRRRARATATTPVEGLSLDADAWTAKFPHLARAPEAFGWTRLTVDGRTLNVLWAFSDFGLARRSPRYGARPGG